MWLFLLTFSLIFLLSLLITVAKFKLDIVQFLIGTAVNIDNTSSSALLENLQEILFSELYKFIPYYILKLIPIVLILLIISKIKKIKEIKKIEIIKCILITYLIIDFLSGILFHIKPNIPEYIRGVFLSDSWLIYLVFIFKYRQFDYIFGLFLQFFYWASYLVLLKEIQSRLLIFKNEITFWKRNI